jgi:hypothetical protein
MIRLCRVHFFISKLSPLRWKFEFWFIQNIIYWLERQRRSNNDLILRWINITVIATTLCVQNFTKGKILNSNLSKIQFIYRLHQILFWWRRYSSASGVQTMTLYSGEWTWECEASIDATTCCFATVGSIGALTEYWAPQIQFVPNSI